MKKLVLLRHGESVWNQKNRFTGWTDVDLTAEGGRQAVRAGRLLRQHGFAFAVGFTSVLKRAIRTLDLVLEEMNLLWVPAEKSWRLHERFYGALQGLNKAETAATCGEVQVQKWRHDPHEHPPALTADDPRVPGHDARHAGLTHRELPLTENLSETMARARPFWRERTMGALQHGCSVMVCAHGNSPRALVQYIDHRTDEAVSALDIPTGVPLGYELDGQLNRLRHHYLD